MYEGGLVLLHRTIPWSFACLYVSAVVYVLYRRLTVGFSSDL